MAFGFKRSDFEPPLYLVMFLTVETVFLPGLFDLILGQTVFRVGTEVIAALLPTLHISILHSEEEVFSSGKILPTTSCSYNCLPTVRYTLQGLNLPPENKKNRFKIDQQRFRK